MTGVWSSDEPTCVPAHCVGLMYSNSLRGYVTYSKTSFAYDEVTPITATYHCFDGFAMNPATLTVRTCDQASVGAVGWTTEAEPQCLTSSPTSAPTSMPTGTPTASCPVLVTPSNGVAPLLSAGVLSAPFTGIQGGVGSTVETSASGANSAIFAITNHGSSSYSFTVTSGGSNYDSSTAGGESIVVKGSTLGGVDGAPPNGNDCTLAVTGAAGSSALSLSNVVATGTPTALNGEFTVATFACDAGYYLSNPIPLVCAASTWSAIAPTCALAACSTLATPTYGSVSIPSLLHSSTATFSCNAGYFLSSSIALTCTQAGVSSTGTWSSAAPTCVRAVCPPLATPSHGSAPLEIEPFNPSPTIKSVLFACNAGFFISYPARINCTQVALGDATGVWSAAEPSCSLIQCPVLIAPKHGAISSHNSVVNATALYSCNPGYTVTLPALRICRQNGTSSEGEWNGTASTCHATACTSAEANAWVAAELSTRAPVQFTKKWHSTLSAVAVTSPFPYSAVKAEQIAATYVCKDGFELQGAAVRVCNVISAHGKAQWSGLAPTCVPAACTALQTPTHGFVEYSSTNLSFTPVPGATASATYRCGVGFTISAPTQRTCSVATAGRVDWTIATEPTCAMVGCAAYDESWISTGVETNPSASKSIVEPLRVVDWDAGVFGDQLAFMCKDQTATVAGPSAPTCVAGGVWRPAPSAADPVTCQCDIGNFMTAEGVCQLCAPNTFAPAPGMLKCDPCDGTKGETSPEGSAFCERATLECPDGTYKDRTNAICLSCPEFGAICQGNEIELLPTWWFDVEALKEADEEVSGSTEVFACLNELACVTDVENVTVACAPGYSSVICGACDLEGQGYMRSGQLCRECDALWYNMAFVGAMGLGAVGYVLYVVAFQDFSSTAGDQRPVVIKIAMSFCQMLTVLGVFKARGTALFNELVQRPASIAGGGISSALPLKCLMNSQIYGAFVMNMITPLAAITLTGFLIGPVFVCKRIQEAMRASHPPPRPPDEKVVFFSCCARLKLEQWERGTWLKQQSQQDKGTFQPGPRFIAVLVFVLFGVYPTLVKSIFGVFRCTEPIGGRRYLEDDYTVQCWVGWHPRMVAIACMCGGLYLFGIPLGLLLILRGNRHRLTEPRFISTFGFVYRGYHTDRGLVVAWESFVMVRKLAVTAITVSSSDPYIQIFVALLLLIISYGLQERIMPFETPLLNNIEGIGLFSLIFTQIVSILYLYIDTRAAATGRTDKVFEIIVTLILMFANVSIVVAMVVSYLFAWTNHIREANKDYAQFVEERDQPFGELTAVRNPKVPPKDRFRLFRTLEDCIVYTKPMLSSEKTGEIAEKGDVVVVSSSTTEYARATCGKGREVEWLQRADGTGWMINCNLRTGDSIVELVGHQDNDGTMWQSFWRFDIISKTSLHIRAGTASRPFVWWTGEVVAPNESLLVDARFIRVSGCGCCKKNKTYLHLADRRGWIVEPSRVPDTDWISQPDYVDKSVLARLVGQEDRVGALNTIGISEYTSRTMLEIYEHDSWPPAKHESGRIAEGATIFVSDRRTVFTRQRQMYVKFGLFGSVSVCVPRSLKCCRRGGRFQTFLKLSDGRGFVVANERRGATEPRVVFKKLRLDSVDNDTGKSRGQWKYVVAVDSPPVLIYHTAIEAATAAQKYGRKKTLTFGKHKDDITMFYPPLNPRAIATIVEKRNIKPRGAFSVNIIVGKMAAGRGAMAGMSGWIVLQLESTKGNTAEFPKLNMKSFSIKELDEVVDNTKGDVRSRNHIVAAQAHDAWREQRKLPNGKFEPLREVVDGVLVDVANTPIDDLPSTRRKAHLAAAEAVCARLASALSGGRTLTELRADESFLDEASALHCGEYAARSDIASKPYRALAEAEKEAHRRVVRIAISAEVAARAAAEAERLAERRAAKPKSRRRNRKVAMSANPMNSRSTRRLQRKQALVDAKAWWKREGIARGDAASHPSRGAGLVVAINPDDDGLVHVEFALSGAVHRYKESSWAKFEHTKNAWWNHRWGGTLGVGTKVLHQTKGPGTVIALSVDGDMRVHVDFGNDASVEAVAEKDWAAMQRVSVVSVAIDSTSVWWVKLGVALGDKVKHAKRGDGAVVAINPDNDGLVHIEFNENGAVHRYAEVSWEKIEHTPGAAWWTRRWNGGIGVGAKVRHPKHGLGTVTALSPDDDLRVHVEFAEGEVHRYQERSWAKMKPVELTQPTAERTKRKARRAGRNKNKFPALEESGGSGTPVVSRAARRKERAAARAAAEKAWWEQQGVARGNHVKHPSRGAGVVVAINVEDDGLVHVEFKSSGSVHCYKETSWGKFEHTGDAWWGHRWNGDVAVGLEVRHATLGAGTVAALSPDGDLCVHIEFASGAVEAITEKGWAAVQRVAAPQRAQAIEWWTKLGIVLGDVVQHPTRGAGAVVSINAEGDAKVHVEFDESGTVQCYTKGSWRSSLQHTQNAWWMRRWNGGVVVGAPVRHPECGVGSIVALAPNDDRCVHVDFADGSHRAIAEVEWGTMLRERGAAASKRRALLLEKIALVDEDSDDADAAPPQKKLSRRQKKRARLLAERAHAEEQAMRTSPGAQKRMREQIALVDGGDDNLLSHSNPMHGSGSPAKAVVIPKGKMSRRQAKRAARAAARQDAAADPYEDTTSMSNPMPQRRSGHKPAVDAMQPTTNPMRDGGRRKKKKMHEKPPSELNKVVEAEGGSYLAFI